ncbi:hypothetical protein [Flavobacterium acetivorans]|uniref:hypothetical protein n=1 Tax=Flavobacterium acetivorans TaxID=2893883 RepID=UPI001E2E6597|nr:hypothetical protein [Flavobacterium sp. F-29]UFH35069.1 hypothetical protein LNP19_13390 [Flavobacterium sp. F-29]
MTRIDINDPNLTIDDMPTNWGGAVWLYNEEPFTGIRYEYFPGTIQLSSEAEFMDGIQHGRQAEYWTNGQIKIEFFENYGGKFYGSFKEWNDQGVLITYQEHDNFGNLIKKII